MTSSRPSAQKLLLAAGLASLALAVLALRTSSEPTSSSASSPSTSLPGNISSVPSSSDPLPFPPVVLKPGLVLLRSVLTPSEQSKLTSLVLQYGHQSNKFWISTSHPHTSRSSWLCKPCGLSNSGGSSVSGIFYCTGCRRKAPPPMELNNARQGRGRIYDALKSYPDSEFLERICQDITRRARRVDPTMPPVDPTHLLTMYYTKPKKLGWHRDDGPQDGQSLAPVVSLSLGNNCEFLLVDDDKDPGRDNANPANRISITLRSGDAILFGGEERWIKHTVSSIAENTCPRFLLDVQREEAERHCPEGGWVPPASFRINLTFREAPELLGKEGGEKFYYFATSARKFLKAQEELGVEEARRRVVEKRRGAKEKRQRRKAG